MFKKKIFYRREPKAVFVFILEWRTRNLIEELKVLGMKTRVLQTLNRSDWIHFIY